MRLLFILLPPKGGSPDLSEEPGCSEPALQGDLQGGAHSCWEEPWMHLSCKYIVHIVGLYQHLHVMIAQDQQGGVHGCGRQDPQPVRVLIPQRVMCATHMLLIPRCTTFGNDLSSLKPGPYMHESLYFRCNDLAFRTHFKKMKPQTKKRGKAAKDAKEEPEPDHDAE